MSTIEIVTGFDQNWDTEQRKTVRTPITREVKVGDFLSESLVTDSIVYEVIKVTPKTVTVRSTQDGESFHDDERCDKTANGLGVVWTERVSNPEGSTRTLRVRKDGTVRSGSHVGARPFYPTNKIDGKPVSRRDWRF